MHKIYLNSKLERSNFFYFRSICKLRKHFHVVDCETVQLTSKWVMQMNISINYIWSNDEKENCIYAKMGKCFVLIQQWKSWILNNICNDDYNESFIVWPLLPSVGGHYKQMLKSNIIR